jgi:hypothetical protein
MTEEEAIQRAYARGMAAEHILTDPVLAEVVTELENRYIADWMTSEPQHVKSRETAYYKSLALREIVGELQSWVTTRDQLKAELGDTAELN